MAYLFWLIAAGVLAVISHISILLFLPGYYFDETLNRLASQNPRNSFFILSEQAQIEIFPEFPQQSIYGICRFDLRTGPVSLHTVLPHTFWTLTIYDRNGKTLYTVNDKQTGADELDLQLVKAPRIFDIFTKSDDVDDIINAAVWRVSSSDPKGFAVLWVPLADAAMRKNYSDILSKSTCSLSEKTDFMQNPPRG